MGIDRALRLKMYGFSTLKDRAVRLSDLCAAGEVEDSAAREALTEFVEAHLRTLPMPAEVKGDTFRQMHSAIMSGSWEWGQAAAINGYVRVAARRVAVKQRMSSTSEVVLDSEDVDRLIERQSVLEPAAVRRDDAIDDKLDRLAADSSTLHRRTHLIDVLSAGMRPEPLTKISERQCRTARALAAQHDVALLAEMAVSGEANEKLVDAVFPMLVGVPKRYRMQVLRSIAGLGPKWARQAVMVLTVYDRLGAAGTHLAHGRSLPTPA